MLSKNKCIQAFIGGYMNFYLMKKTQQFWNSDHNKLLSYLSPDRQKTVKRYRFEQDQITSLYSGFLARLGLTRALGCKNEELIFVNKKWHKPYLDTSKLPGNPYIDFSFSHTRNAVLLGITQTGHIGVDVERISNAPLNLMKTIFHPFETAYVEQASSDLKNRRFLEIWTKKEAYTKCIGTGLATDLPAINTLANPLSEQIYTWSEDDYLCSVCFIDDLAPYLFY